MTKRKLRAMGCTNLTELVDQCLAPQYNIGTYGFFGLAPFDKVDIADYQRVANLQHIKNIRNKFEIRAANPLWLSFRDDRLWGVDSQHTLKAMVGHDTKPYNCHYSLILTGLSYEDECRLFFIRNQSSRRMGGWVKFLADLRHGNPIRQQFLDMAHSRNLLTPLSPGVKRVSDADLNPSTFDVPFERGGLPLVGIVLDVLNSCWRSNGPDSQVQYGASDIAVIRGLSAFVSEHYLGRNPLPLKTLFMVLKKITVMELMDLAKQEQSKGRADARQIHDALCGLMGVKREIKLAD